MSYEQLTLVGYLGKDETPKEGAKIEYIIWRVD
jgi:hypothetical protein